MKKRAIILALLCINGVLLSVVIVECFPPTSATAQSISMGQRYGIGVFNVETKPGLQAAFIVDRQLRRLAAVGFDWGRNEAVMMDTRDLGRDFRRTGAATPRTGAGGRVR
jgi:hypothetical protein